MSKKRTGCVLIVFISMLGSYFFIPQLLLVIITAYLFCAILFWLNRKALKKIQDQKEPFKIGGKIRNVHYLIIGDMAEPSTMVPPNQSFVQIKAPNRSLKASFEILRHTSSILDEDKGNVIIAVKKRNIENTFSVFDIPFLYNLSIKKLRVGNLSKMSKYPILKDPVSTVLLVINHCSKRWHLSTCPNEDVVKFCVERNINLKYYEN